MVPLSLLNDVSIDHSLPSAMEPGSSKTVTVEIDKGKVQGFAKYQINIPEGLSVEMIEGKGASFTFNNGKAKFIWMALPESKKFEISYKLSAAENASGQKKITARFSYIEDNQRRNYDEPEHVLSIGAEPVADQPSEESSTEEDTAATAEEEVTEKEPTPEPTADLTRTITASNNDRLTVEVKIRYSNIEGFARLEENLPEGYTAIDLKSSGAVFNLEEPMVKYLWSSLPDGDSLMVSYRLLPMIDNPQTPVELDGSFSFLKNGETVSVEVGGEGISDALLAEEQEPAEEETTEPKEEEQKAEEDDQAKAETEETLAEQPEKQEEKPQEEKKKRTQTGEAGNMIVDVPDPDKGVNYRVQIAAGKNNVPVTDFKKRHQFFEAVYLENINTWFKYTTGSHGIYKEARDDRERITDRYDSFKGPFVAAYNNGERITVQEALMITEQKWYP